MLLLALIGSMWLLLSLIIAQRVALGLSLCTSSSVRTSLLESVMVKTCTGRKACEIASRHAPQYSSQLAMRKTVLILRSGRKWHLVIELGMHSFLYGCSQRAHTVQGLDSIKRPCI